MRPFRIDSLPYPFDYTLEQKINVPTELLAKDIHNKEIADYLIDLIGKYPLASIRELLAAGNCLSSVRRRLLNI